MTTSDADLVKAACQGDLASFGQLYNRYYALAVGLGFSRLLDRHLAEDAAQEAFAIACKRLSSLKDGASFRQWMCVICRREATRLARDRPAHRALLESQDAQPTGDSGTTRTDVLDAVGRLDQASREIVLLHYYSGLTYEEISSALGLSTQAIHGRLQRARRKLASYLEVYSTQGSEDEDPSQ